MTHMQQPSSFTLRTYGKSELAMLYFPQSATPHTAVNHLMAWINRSVRLKGLLQEAGYMKTSKYFTPRQVAVIVEHLGEP